MKELEQLSGVSILAGNVTEAGSGFFANDGTLIKTVDGVKVGVFGVFDPVLADSTAPQNVDGLSILEKSIDIGLQNKRAYDEWKETGFDKVRWPDDDGNHLQFSGMTVLYDT